MKPRLTGRLYIAAGAVVAASLVIFIFSMLRSLKTENTLLKARQAELMSMKDEALKLRDSISSVEGKKSLTKVEGIVQASDEIFKSLGLGQKVKSIKPSGSIERQYGVEEEAEIQIEKMSMNELTNLLYRIENAPMVLSAKKATMKVSFDNPSLLNVTMVISLIRQK